MKGTAMAATTFTHLPGRKTDAPSGSWLTRFFDRVIEARAAQVRHQINAQLRYFDDETLRAIGFTDADVARLHNGEMVELPR
jgi:hypothetical protein